MNRFDNFTERYPDDTMAVDALALDIPAVASQCSSARPAAERPPPCEWSAGWSSPQRVASPSTARTSPHGPPAQLRRPIGYVIQHAGFCPHRTALANVMTAPRLLGWGRAHARTAAMKAIEKVGLTADQARAATRAARLLIDLFPRAQIH